MSSQKNQSPGLISGVIIVLVGAVVFFLLLGTFIGGAFDAVGRGGGEASMILGAIAVMAGVWWWRGAKDLKVLQDKGYRWATRRDAVRLRNLTGAEADEIPTAAEMEFNVVSVEELAAAVEERRRGGGEEF